MARALGLVEVKPRLGTRRREYSFTPAIRQSLGYALALDDDHFRKVFRAAQSRRIRRSGMKRFEKLTDDDKQELQNLVARAWEKLRGTPIQVPHEEHRLCIC